MNDRGFLSDQGAPVRPPMPNEQQVIPGGVRRRLAIWLYTHRRVQLGLLLGTPLGWLAIAYLGSLAILLLSAFWTKDTFTGNVEPFTWSLKAFQTLFASEVYRTVAIRTVGMASLVTVTCALLALPIAYYMARIASPRKRSVIVVAVLVPLWAAYLAFVALPPKPSVA